MRSKIGIAVIVLVFVVSLNPYALIFVFPFFVIGCALLWLGKASLKKKIIFTIAPLILWYPGFMGFMHFNAYIGPKLAQKIEYRIPDGFKGQVTVIFPVHCGQEVRKNNGREIINVPENGIVYYQGVIKPGYVNWTYNLQRFNKISEIYEFKSWNMTEEELNKIKPDSLGVFLGGGWTTSSMSSEPRIDYNVRTFVIDHWKNKGHHNFQKNQDSITPVYEKEIRKCKQSL